MTAGDDTTGGFGRGMVLLAGANAAYIVTTYVVTTTTARVLDPVDFGGFGVVMAWITLLTALLVKGLATSMSREMAAGVVDAGTAWRAGCGLAIRLSVSLAVVGAAVSPVAARVLGADGLAEELAVGSLAALTFGVNAALLAWPTGNRDYARQAIAQLSYAMARAVLVLGGAMAFGLEGAVIGYVLAPLVAAAPLLTAHPAAHADLATVRRRMLRAVVPVAFASVATAAFFVVDVFVLSGAVGEDSAQVGIYVAYGTIAHVPFFLLQAASIAIVPALAATRSAAARAAAIRGTTTDTFVLLAGPTLVLATAGDAAARIVFGAEYETSAVIVLPLALATGAVSIATNFVAVDVAIGRLRTSLAACVLGVVALAVLGAWAARLDTGTPAGNVAWAALAASAATAAVLAVDLRLRHGALLDARRAGLGLVVAAVAAAPPLVVDGDAAKLEVAVACGIGWLVAVVRLGLVDVARSAPNAEEPQ